RRGESDILLVRSELAYEMTVPSRKGKRMFTGFQGPALGGELHPHGGVNAEPHQGGVIEPQIEDSVADASRISVDNRSDNAGAFGEGEPALGIAGCRNPAVTQ